MKNTGIHYAIVGDGRLARHMRHYLGLLKQECSGWSRNGASPFNSHSDPDPRTRLQRTIRPASHVLLLISDDAISGLLRKYPFLHRRRLVHCAGALSLPDVAGAHPLMTFSRSLYSFEQYLSIPFLVDAGERFEELFPALPNPHHQIDPQQKARYHALCVAAGNFPQILWQAVSARFANNLSIPPGLLAPYLHQVTSNFLQNPGGALTGPLARRDSRTVARNLSALEHDPLQALYQTFLDFYRGEQFTGRGRLQEQELVR